ncbi:MAG: hypothetical protein M1812_006819 [Candelaria pacifica]|nr:MAG: hypothetical protein M1812_006819 [Candelaria pacifica]
MIGTSFPELLLIRTSIAFIRAVTPLSILYCIALPFIPSYPVPLIVGIWPIAETCFYFLVYHPWKRLLQRPITHPPLVSRDERRKLFERCQNKIPEPDRYLSKWFLDAPLREIKRDNVKEFYRWAFLNSGTHSAADEEELEEYTDGLEKIIGRNIASGRGSAKCLRLTLDEVKPRHRPLVWYLTVFAVDNFTHMSMLYHKFRYHRTRMTPYPTVFPFRPQTLLTTHHSPARTLSYWYRPHKSTTKLPVVFLHGIGIGLMPYVPFLGALNGASGNEEDVGIIAVELLPVSFRMTHGGLGKAETCREIQQILLRHGFEKFVLVSHSYGSVITTHLLKSPGICDQVASLILVDPVSILLHLPDVAYNFTYRRPRRANERQLWYFASTDIGVAHTLARCFFWSENILWKEDMGDRKVSVFLSGRDLIVNTEQVGRYLTGQHGPREDDDADWKADPDGWVGENGMKVVWCHELDHAQIFDSKFWMPRLVDEVHVHSEQK